MTHEQRSCRRSARWRALAIGMLLALPAADGWCYIVSIASGNRTLFLQVGQGTITGGTFNSGGTPGNNSTINTVTATVPAANVGTGPVAMTTDSTAQLSPWDGFNFCPNVGSTVYVGGFFRAPSGGGNAVLTAQSPANLVNPAGDTIPFNNISWVSSGSGDTTPTVPSGTFTGGTQTLFSFSRNQWFESCMAFTYDNDLIVPSGTYTGRVTYTLTAP